jgi:transposase
MRSRIGPMKKIGRSLRRHRHLILNWCRARGTISAGVVEGFNGKAKLTIRKAFGFRTPQGIEIALFHVLGRLPEPSSLTDSTVEVQRRVPLVPATCVPR